MPSVIKRDGVRGRMLVAMARRGGSMTSDRTGFPPSRVFLPLRRQGLVRFDRQQGLGRCNYNVWTLTPKGWEGSGMQPPVVAEAPTN